MTPTLKVPYAIDCTTGDIVKATNAGKTTRYQCLDCQCSLVLRAGGQRQKHFSHPPTSNSGCSGESLNHKAAKLLLAQQLRRDLNANRKVNFQQYCPGANGECKLTSLISDSRPIESWTAVELKIAYLDFRLDVAIMNGSDVVFGFEVYHRHEVPDHKSRALQIPWMELIADDILAFKPRIPHRYEKSKSLCEDCVDLRANLDARKPEDDQRDSATSSYREEAKRLKTTWQLILSKARTISQKKQSHSRK